MVTVGSMRSGQANNVIPEQAILEIGVRAVDRDVRALLEKRVQAIIRAQAESFGVQASIDWRHGYPVLVNSEAETAFALGVAQELVGAENTQYPFGPVTGSEDFACYLQHRPGCFLRLGNGDTATLHNPRYDFNDANLTLGAAYWTRLVETYLPAAA